MVGLVVLVYLPRAAHARARGYVIGRVRLYSGFQVGCHKNFHTCAISPFKIDNLNGSTEHASIVFVTTNLKTAVYIFIYIYIYISVCHHEKHEFSNYRQLLAL